MFVESNIFDQIFKNKVFEYNIFDQISKNRYSTQLTRRAKLSENFFAENSVI